MADHVLGEDARTRPCAAACEREPILLFRRPVRKRVCNPRTLEERETGPSGKGTNRHDNDDGDDRHHLIRESQLPATSDTGSARSMPTVRELP